LQGLLKFLLSLGLQKFAMLRNKHISEFAVSGIDASYVRHRV